MFLGKGGIQYAGFVARLRGISFKYLASAGIVTALKL
jgi:hypothetical protein